MSEIILSGEIVEEVLTGVCDKIRSKIAGIVREGNTQACKQLPDLATELMAALSMLDQIESSWSYRVTPIPDNSDNFHSEIIR